MKILGIDRQSGFSNIPKAIEADRKDKFGPLELGGVRVAHPAPALQHKNGQKKVSAVQCPALDQRWPVNGKHSNWSIHISSHCDHLLGSHTHSQATAQYQVVLVSDSMSNVSMVERTDYSECSDNETVSQRWQILQIFECWADQQRSLCVGQRKFEMKIFSESSAQWAVMGSVIREPLRCQMGGAASFAASRPFSICQQLSRSVTKCHTVTLGAAAGKTTWQTRPASICQHWFSWAQIQN